MVVVEKIQNFHLDSSELLGQLELCCETAPKLSASPQFFLNFILLLCDIFLGYSVQRTCILQFSRQ